MNENVIYTMYAICNSYKLSQETIDEMVSWGIAEPTGNIPEKWLFTQKDFDRIGRASRFSKDLNINIPGAALALELIEDIQKLRKMRY